MGLLDDYDRLLRGKPKVMPLAASGGFDPTAAMGMTAGDELDPFSKGRLAEALEVRGPAEPYVPGGTLAGPNQQRAFAAGDQPGAGFGPTPPQGRNLATAVADAAPPKINLAEMNFGFGDKEFPMKEPGRMAQGLQMTPPEPLPTAFGPPAPTQVATAAPTPSPSMPEPGGGLLKKTSLPATAPLPPTRSAAGLGGMPVTRSAARLPPPTPAPAGLGGASQVASTTAPPFPSTGPLPPTRPPGLGVDASGGLLAQAPIVPPAPPIAPIIPPAPPIGSMAGAAGAGAGAAAGAAGAAGAGAGALGGLGGALGAIGALASAFGGGKKGPPPPQAKAPELPPPRAGAESAQQEAASRSQAPQILQGILASSAQNSLDPRKRRQLA